MAVVGGGSGPETGVYATFETASDVEAAVNTYGWPGVGAAAGSGIGSSPYTQVNYGSDGTTTIDQVVENAYAKANFWWLSLWTVSGPDSSTDADWKSAAETAAKQVAGPTVMAAANSGGFVPAFVVLDAEGQYQPSTQGQFQAMVEGWVSGLAAVSSELTAALYTDQSNFSSWDVNSFGVPSFVAVDLQSYTGPVTGSNIVGYLAYYGTCTDGSASGSVSTVDSWGANMNTLQFSTQSYTCKS